MTWIRIDDHALDHAKIDRLSNRAFRLWMRGLQWAERNFTDGFIPTTDVRTLKGFTSTSYRELTSGITADRAPLWEEREDGIQVHDYLDWNDDAETKQKRRTDGFLRVHKHRTKRVTNGACSALQNALQTDVQNALQIDDPQPVQEASSSEERRTSGGHPLKPLFERYIARFRERFDVDPDIQRGKDGAILAKVLAKYGEARVLELLDTFFASDDAFIQRSGYTIGVFKSVLNKLLTAHIVPRMAVQHTALRGGGSGKAAQMVRMLATSQKAILDHDD